jgi:O-6-methylguanine DNA methyltransferase
LDSNAWVQVDRPLVREQPGALGLSSEDTDLLQVVDRAVEQLVAYSQGRLREFSLPLKFTGTEFQNSVWKALLEVPYGQTTTYGELAKRIGMPKGARAVGGALNRNPLGIVVPCHRVVGSDGAMVGFAGGIDVKKLLLELELRGKLG